MLCGSRSFCVRNSYKICSELCRSVVDRRCLPNNELCCGCQQYIAGFDVHLFLSDGVESNVGVELLWG